MAAGDLTFVIDMRRRTSWLSMSDGIPVAPPQYRPALPIGCGNQTLNLAIPHLERFADVGVFSSRIIGGGRGAAPSAETPSAAFGEGWEKQSSIG